MQLTLIVTHILRSSCLMSLHWSLQAGTLYARVCESVRVCACGWLRWIWIQKTNKETRDWYLESYPPGFELNCAAWRCNDPLSRQGACCQRWLGKHSVGSLCLLLQSKKYRQLLTVSVPLEMYNLCVLEYLL